MATQNMKSTKFPNRSYILFEPFQKFADNSELFDDNSCSLGSGANFLAVVPGEN